VSLLNLRSVLPRSIEEERDDLLRTVELPQSGSEDKDESLD